MDCHCTPQEGAPLISLEVENSQEDLAPYYHALDDFGCWQGHDN